MKKHNHVWVGRSNCKLNDEFDCVCGAHKVVSIQGNKITSMFYEKVGGNNWRLYYTKIEIDSNINNNKKK